ncbi:MAG: hypothetical protein QME82_09200 [Bacillota bacterium]|nr:hypothetical protein [Bacillota bacterium]
MIRTPFFALCPSRLPGQEPSPGAVIAVTNSRDFARVPRTAAPAKGKWLRSSCRSARQFQPPDELVMMGIQD